MIVYNEQVINNLFIERYKLWIIGKRRPTLEEEAILKKLKDFSEKKNLTKDSILQTVGKDYGSWYIFSCDECAKTVEEIVQLGEELDYDSATANVCFNCLKKAISLCTTS